MIFEALKILAIGLALLGAYFVASSKRSHRSAGFSVWIIGNTIWFINSILLQDWIQTFLWIAYQILAVRGIRNNRKPIEENRKC